MIGAYFSKPDFHNTDYWDPFGQLQIAIPITPLINILKMGKLQEIYSRTD